MRESLKENGSSEHLVPESQKIKINLKNFFKCGGRENKEEGKGKGIIPTQDPRQYG